MTKLPAIPIRVERDHNGFWFYNDNVKWPASCTCVISINQSGGMTMAADFIRVLGVEIYSVGDKVFDPRTRRWM